MNEYIMNLHQLFHSVPQEHKMKLLLNHLVDKQQLFRCAHIQRIFIALFAKLRENKDLEKTKLLHSTFFLGSSSYWIRFYSRLIGNLNAAFFYSCRLHFVKYRLNNIRTVNYYRL